MQLHVEEKDVIYMYFIIAIIYTSFSLLPYLINIINNAITFTTGFRSILDEDDNDKNNDKKSKNKAKKKQSQVRLWIVLLIETLIILLCIVVCLLLIYLVAFLYLLATTEVKFMDNFEKTLKFIDTFLWRGGDLLPFYLPFAISAIVIFLVMSFYIAGSKSFVTDMAFASLTPIPDVDVDVDADEETIDENIKDDQEQDDDFNKEDTENVDKINDDNNNDIDETNATTLKIPGIDVSNTEMFRKYYTLMIMLIGLFMLIFLFVHFWDTDKATFAMYTSFIFILMICAIVSQKGGTWNIVFYVSLAVCATINYYSVFRSSTKK